MALVDPPGEWPPRIVIVGPTGSGKSTLAADYAAHYQTLTPETPPVLIDYDLIAEALGSPDPHHHPEAHRLAALAAWLGAVRKVRRFEAPVVLIHAHPERPFDKLYYTANGWHVIDLTPTTTTTPPPASTRS